VTDVDDELADLFREETLGRLDQMDAALLAVESGDAGAESVDSLFRNAHTIKGSAGMVGFDDIRILAHAVEDILASVRETGVFPPELAAPLLRATAVLRAQAAGAQTSIDGLLDELAASLALLPGRAASPAEPSPPDTSPPAASPPEPGTAETSPPDTNLSETGPPDTKTAARAPQDPASGAERRQMRVSAAKIDQLLDIVGELMQYRGRLGHWLSGQTQLSPQDADMLTGGEHMLAELKDTAVGLRTLPLAAITGRLPRAIRDLARAAGKDVEFVVTGADTELDRLILESLSEPLTHLLRNAVTHGIELPAERQRAKKPARGRIELRAVPRGSVVEIIVADDGKGISPQVIDESRRAGSLADVLARPGYSTAPEITDLAGRGVGLDAVKSYVKSLGGTLDVQSEPGRGMTVTLLLPLALALLEVLLFERGDAVYGVPLVVVDEVVTVRQILALEGRPALVVHDQPLPIADVALLIGATAPPLGDCPPALVISAGGRQAVVTCDAVLGEKEIVVKPLGPLYADAHAYLGTAILGDGRIALLIEPSALTTASPHISKPAAPSTAERPATPKVLVVEDSFTVRELQRSILEAAGYPVVTARDGRDALGALDRDPEIALVVTDLEMPELDGLGLTRAIRADRARSSLPVVVVTSRGSEDDRRKGVEAGADAYMTKQSFDQQALLATVERLVGR
jgi:two-component system, chemotaxis family, sensor kinase CheA